MSVLITRFYYEDYDDSPEYEDVDRDKADEKEQELWENHKPYMRVDL